MFIEKYKGWAGTREELVNVLKNIEDKFPDKFALFSKSSGKKIELKKTRIQRLIELGVMPGPIFGTEKSTKNAKYVWLHIISYVSAIVARKSGYTFEQIPPLFWGYDEEELLKFVESDNQSATQLKKKFKQKNLAQSKHRMEVLKELGRKEGRALISDQKLLAITPWLHVYISKKQARRIGLNEAEVLADIFKESILSVSSD